MLKLFSLIKIAKWTWGYNGRSVNGKSRWMTSLASYQHALRLRDKVHLIKTPFVSHIPGNPTSGSKWISLDNRYTWVQPTARRCQARLTEPEIETENINWDVICISGVRQKINIGLLLISSYITDQKIKWSR